MSVEKMQIVARRLIDFKRQIRHDAEDASLEGMSVSLKAVGQLQPVRLRRSGDRFIVVDGERRVRAADLLGWESLAAIIEERELCPAEIIQRQLISNCQRKSLKPAEFGHAIEELIEATGWTLKEVSAMTGFSVAMISKYRPLVDLPEAMQQKVNAGEIAADTAYHLARIGDPAKQQEMLDAAANGHLTRDAACAAVNAAKNGATPAGKAKVSRFKVSLEQGVVTISGGELTPETVVGLLAELLKRARKLHSRGLTGDAFVRGLRDASPRKKRGTQNENQGFCASGAAERPDGTD